MTEINTVSMNLQARPYMIYIRTDLRLNVVHITGVVHVYHVLFFNAYISIDNHNQYNVLILTEEYKNFTT